MDLIKIAESAGLAKIIEKVETVLKNDKKNIQRVAVIAVPFKFGNLDFDRISTTLQTKPDEPQIRIENPLDASDVRITAITLIPDVSFQTKGIVTVEIAEVTVLPKKDAGKMADLNNLPFSIPDGGWLLERGQSIDVYAWTSDGTASAITCVVHFQR